MLFLHTEVCECPTLLENSVIGVFLASPAAIMPNCLDGGRGSSGKINQIPTPSPPAATLLMKVTTGFVIQNPAGPLKIDKY